MSLPANHHWWSYDSVAASYDRLLASSYFLPPARDLVALLDPPQHGQLAGFRLSEEVGPDRWTMPPT
jgi:hypothetical protein